MVEYIYEIMKRLKNKPDDWRNGQAIFNYAYDLFPNECDKLTGTEFDCFYDDNKIYIFLKKLEKELGNKQLTLFNIDNVSIKEETKDGEEDKTKVLNNSNIIRNISFDQKEILWNIMKLYNDGQPFDCDMTASSLKFYEHKNSDKYTIPEPKILFDVFPQQDKIKKIDPYGKLPLEDKSINSIVIDLPFVVSPPEAPSAKNPKEGSSLIFKRFYGFYPVDDLYTTYYHWISEAYRVLKENGICIFKTQSTISGGVQHNVEEFSYMCAQRVGFTGEDKFILEAKSRLISAPKMKTQQHARKFTSVFWVFKKTLKKKSKNFNYFELIEKCKEIENNRYNDEI